MSTERENAHVDQIPPGENEVDDSSLSSESAEVRAKLRMLAKKRAMLREEKWRALARGTASADDVTALEEKSATSPEARELFEIARPKTMTPKPLAKSKTLRRIGAALLLAAGAAAVWFGKTAFTPPAPTAALVMPAYEKKVQGGIAATLGDDERKIIVLPAGTGTMLDVKLSPPSTMLVSRYKDLRGQVFLVHFGTIQPLNTPVVVDSSGIATVKGTRETLFAEVPDGLYDIWIVIGPASEVSTNPESVLQQFGKKERTISISKLTVHLEGGETKRTPILDVRFTGCTDIVAAPNIDPVLPECHLDKSNANPIRLRLEAAPGAVITGRTPAGKMDADLELATTPAGTSIALPTEKLTADGDIVIEATLGQKRAVFRLPVRRVEPQADLAQASNLANRGQRAEAYKALQSILASHPGGEREARAHALMGRIDRDEKRYAEAIEHLQKSIELDRSAGRLSAEISDAAALSEIFAVRRHDPMQARKVLEDLEPLAAHVPEALVKLPYYGAIAAAQSGDLRTTLRLYDQTLTLAEKTGLDRFQADAKFALAEIFVKLGRFDEARVLQKEFLGRLVPKTDSACYVADTKNQAGWVEYLAGYVTDNGSKALNEANSYFQQALNEACEDPFQRANVRTNLALVALAQNNSEEVRTQLAEAKKAHEHPGPFLEDWWTLLESRVLIREGEKDANNAKKAIQDLETLLEHAVDAEVRLDAWLARAEAHDVLGDKAARQAYADADVDGLRYALGVELTTGAGAFLAVHGRATERRIDYLLRMAEKQPREANGYLREAADAARRSRLRILASLPGRVAIEESLAKTRQKLAEGRNTPNPSPQSQQQMVNQAFAALLQSIGISPDAPLAPPNPGELGLVYHPLGRGYVGFAMTEGSKILAKRLDISSLDKLSEQEISDRLLEPFRAEIEKAQRIRFAPHGAALARVNFHALPWGKGTLIEALPVAYAIDLGQTPREVPPKEKNRPGVALLVTGDAKRTLPGAQRETEAVARELREKLGFSIRSQPTATTSDVQAFQDALANDDVQLFHFVGHGYFKTVDSNPPSPIYQPDLDGWESGIRLEDGSLFSARRIMGLSRVPPLVILSACEVGNMVDKVNGLSFGLPQAFIVKGSRAVLAATVPLQAGKKDKSGLHEKLVQALMTSENFPKDLPAALRDAQMKLRDEPEWAAIRVFVP